MAWISVHDHIEGKKLRELAKEIGCSRKEALGILISLWLWGINNADKTGELKCADKYDVAEAISSGLSQGISPLNVVDAMITTSWLDEVDGLLFLHDWDVWQEQWYKFLSQREYDAKRKREARKRQKEEAEKGHVFPEPPKKTPVGNEDNNLNEDTPEVPPKKPKKPKKPKEEKEKPEKIKYADFVSMHQTEYEKLENTYGKAFTLKCISVLDLYKGSKGATYKDDYRAILSWVVGKVEKEYPNLKKNRNEPSQSSGNPFI